MFSELYGGAMDIIKNASETIFKRLVWLTARRDQAGIADKLANEQVLVIALSHSYSWRYLQSLRTDDIGVGGIKR